MDLSIRALSAAKGRSAHRRRDIRGDVAGACIRCEATLETSTDSRAAHFGIGYRWTPRPDGTVPNPTAAMPVTAVTPQLRTRSKPTARRPRAFRRAAGRPRPRGARPGPRPG